MSATASISPRTTGWSGAGRSPFRSLQQVIGPGAARGVPLDLADSDMCCAEHGGQLERLRPTQLQVALAQLAARSIDIRPERRLPEFPMPAQHELQPAPA